MIDIDLHRKKRIANWLASNAKEFYGIPDSPISHEELLLMFEKYLGDCEEERQKALLRTEKM